MQKNISHMVASEVSATTNQYTVTAACSGYGLLNEFMNINSVAVASFNRSRFLSLSLRKVKLRHTFSIAQDVQFWKWNVQNKTV